MEFKRKFIHFDFLLLFAVIALSAFGIVMIGSATHKNITGYSSEYNQQIIFVLSGILILLITSFIDLNFVFKFYYVIYAVNILLLILVFVIGTADSSGVKRWIRFPGGGIQPSEFTKIFLIVFWAKFLEVHQKYINTPKILLSFVALLSLPVMLIVMQPSLSASLIPIIVSCVMLYAAGLDKRIVFWVLGLGITVSGLIILDSLRTDPFVVDLIMQPYQIERIRSAFARESAGDNFYQTGYAIKAIGSGQLHGKGLYHGTINQLNFLSESHNDFIFSVICEEFGFVGAVTVIGVFTFIIFKCLYIGYRTKILSKQLLCVGVATMIAAQVFINIGVNIGFIPNTGMPLPFMSAGGSSMWVNMASIGFCLNVSMERPKSIFEG